MSRNAGSNLHKNVQFDDISSNLPFLLLLMVQFLEKSLLPGPKKRLSVGRVCVCVCGGGVMQAFVS